MAHFAFHSPVGQLTLSEEDGQIVSLDWGAGPNGQETALIAEARSQLDAYFAGQRQGFDLPLSPMGTPFQRKVWAAMAAIPFGRTRSYGEIAAELGSAARAVGQACGRNPIPILIPCHRVLAGNGGIGGYSAIDGTDSKRYLLRLEGVTL